MGEVIEKVSLAIDPEWWDGWESCPENMKLELHYQAHVLKLDIAKRALLAVLEAIREPTEVMVEAGQIELAKDSDCHAFDRHYAGVWDTWRAMIDAKRAEIEEKKGTSSEPGAPVSARQNLRRLASAAREKKDG
jgi:hypothetical protein